MTAEDSGQPRRIVVVGGGLAAGAAVTELRAQGYDGELTLFAAEPRLPYERPGLSKGVLLGKEPEDKLFVRDEQWYADNEVDVRAGTPVESVDLAAREVSAGGERFGYDRLLLATGSQPRRLPMFEDVPAHYLRTIEDCHALQEVLNRRLLIVGAGWIGLEVAAAARDKGGEVTVVEPQAQPLQGVLGERMGAYFAALHREHGVDLRLETTVTAVQDGPDGVRATLSDGSEITADAVVVGIGAAPDVDLADAAGLAVDNGVLVDATLRTSDPNVYAAGDIASEDHPVLGRLRVEHWDTAKEQGAAAARAMLGDETPYTRQPYFFTDQYDLGMEYVGHAGAGDFDEVVVRGDESLDDGAGPLTAYWLKGDLVLAGMHVNDWDATARIRTVVGRHVDPADLA